MTYCNISKLGRDEHSTNNLKNHCDDHENVKDESDDERRNRTEMITIYRYDMRCNDEDRSTDERGAN